MATPLERSFHFSRSRLNAILRQLDAQFLNAVEFRHRSWWNRTVFNEFEKAGLIFCSVSGPRLPDDLVQTSEAIYLRFHGTKKWYRYDYGREELRARKEKVDQSGAKEIWAYFNNDREGNAIRNGSIFRKLLKPSSKRILLIGQKEVTQFGSTLH